MSEHMILCCDPSLRERARYAVERGWDAIRHGDLQTGDGASSWNLNPPLGGPVSVNVVDGGFSIDITAPHGQDPLRDMALSVPMPETVRHHDREAVESLIEDLGSMLSRSLSPDDQKIVGRTAGLRNMAMDMSAVLADAGIAHTAVRLRCAMQRRAAAFVAGGRRPMLRMDAPYANWNDELQNSPHGFAEIQPMGAGGTHLMIGGAVVDIDSIGSSTMEVLRRLPGIAPHLRKII